MKWKTIPQRILSWKYSLFMYKEIKLTKVASQTFDMIKVKTEDQNLILLEYLRDINSYPIASSCNGEGICRKCVFNDELLLCKTKVKDSPKEIRISYL